MDSKIIKKPLDITWITCVKCNKKLMQSVDGIGIFRYGSNRSNNQSVVELRVFGTVAIKCFRRKCQYNNIFSFFPENMKDLVSPTRKDQ